MKDFHLRVWKTHSLLLLLLLSPVSLWSAPRTLDREQMWEALKSQIQSLRQEKKYSEALSLLDDFERRTDSPTESPVLRAEVKFQKAALLLKELNQLDKGFLLLEQSVMDLPANLQEKGEALKSEFAKPVTQRRLNRWNDGLIRYFALQGEFPKDLPSLASFSGKAKQSLKDGYGFAFVYRLGDHPAFAGEDTLRPLFFSVGLDGKEGTEDDLLPEAEEEAHSMKLVDGIRLVDTFQDEGQWVAEVALEDKGGERTQKIKEGDTLLDYQVFGIADEGVVLIREQEPVLLRK